MPYIEDKTDLLIYIIFFILGIIFIFFIETTPIREVNKAIKNNSYNCKTVINSEKNNKYQYLYYIKDTNCKDNVSEKEPFIMVKFNIYKNHLIIKNKENKNELWYNNVNDYLNKHKLNKKCNDCITIKQKKKVYYIKAKDLKKLDSLFNKYKGVEDE